MRVSRLSRWLCCVLLVCAAASAQTAPAAADAAKNPVLTVVKQMFEGRARVISASADAMPADKWTYKPTAGQDTFAQVMTHIATSNAFLCARIGDATAPETVTSIKPEDGKDKISAAVKASFDFCREALGKTDDSKLGDEIAFRGNNKLPRARAVVELPVDLYDHYAALAGYLRLNGILPPSAQPPPRPAQPPK